MWKSGEGSTGRLLQLCLGYFTFYIVTGLMVKFFIGGILREPMAGMTYLFNNTLGGSMVALGVVLVLRWFRLKSNNYVKLGPFNVPQEVLYIVPSGVCTAVIIPTTTLMYSLPISVMVAMVIMRGSVIVISRVVDALQIRQGILKKRVYAEENWGVVFALLAVGTVVLLIPAINFLESRGVEARAFATNVLRMRESDLAGGFRFLKNGAALTIMGLYISAYSFRIYIMNYYKNTRGKGAKQDNKSFFGIEQLAASGTMMLAALFFFNSPAIFGWTDQRIMDFRAGIMNPEPLAVLSGVPFGIVAFFSVFIFMFKGRTATFAGLVNRLTSLLAGTTATLILFLFFGQRPPKPQDWVSLLFILTAVYFLTRAEKLRAAELGAEAASELQSGALPAGAKAGRKNG